MHRLWLVITLLLGCGGQSSNPGPSSGPLTMAAEVTIGPFALDPGTEMTKCITRRLPTTLPIDIARIESTLAPGSHHLILYQSTETAEVTEPVDCTPFVGILSGTVPLFLGQSPESQVDFPPGVTFTLEAGQMYRLEAHYINTTPSPVMAMGSARIFTYANPTQITAHANVIIYANAGINIPPGETATLGPTSRSVTSRTVKERREPSGRAS